MVAVFIKTNIKSKILNTSDSMQAHLIKGTGLSMFALVVHLTLLSSTG